MSMFLCPSCGKTYDDSWRICLNCDNTRLVPEGSIDLSLLKPKAAKEPRELHWSEISGLLIFPTLLAFIAPLTFPAPVIHGFAVLIAGVAVCSISLFISILIYSRNPKKAFSLGIFYSILVHAIIATFWMTSVPEGLMWLPVSFLTGNGYVFPLIFGIACAISKLIKVYINPMYIAASYLKSFLIIWLAITLILVFVSQIEDAKFNKKIEQNKIVFLNKQISS